MRRRPMMKGGEKRAYNVFMILRASRQWLLLSAWLRREVGWQCFASKAIDMEMRDLLMSHRRHPFATETCTDVYHAAGELGSSLKLKFCNARKRQPVDGTHCSSNYERKSTEVIKLLKFPSTIFPSNSRCRRVLVASWWFAEKQRTVVSCCHEIDHVPRAAMVSYLGLDLKS